MAVLSVYCGSGSGFVGNSGATWSTVRTAATGDSATVNPSSADNWFQCYFGGGTYTIYRNFYPADTSALGSGASISAATLNIYFGSKTPNADSCVLHVVSTSQASTTTLTTSDFDQVGSTSYGSVTVSGITTSAINAFSLNASGLSAISKTGTTTMGVIFNLDKDDSAPTGNNYFDTAFPAYTGTSRDPYYEITYTTASGPANLKTWDGLAKASIKTMDGLAIASVKSWNGLT